MSRILIVLFVVLAFAAPAFAQDDAPAPTPDFLSWLQSVDTELIIVVLVGVLAFAFRSAVLEAVRGAVANVPPGVIGDILESASEVVYSAVDRALEAREIDALKTPSPLDEQAIREMRETLREIYEIVNPDEALAK